ncbi:TPA: tail fiber protein [Stenotrophomonas maltophilia]|nr:tail fiber protein [Stenotrophomonas maltophilia]HDS1041947.1 tail fiber protein [Stenotrophomonas maltophilia]
MIGEVPVGTVCMYAGDVAYVASSTNPAWPPPQGGVAPPPSGGGHDGTLLEALGWMVCDGRELACAKYPHLYAAIGNLHGGDPGRGVFRLPDLRGVFVRGVDNGAGADPDPSARTRADGQGSYAGVGSLQLDALQVHQHTYDAPGQTAAAGEKGPACNPPLKGQPSSDPISARTSDNETRARNAALHYIIRVQPAPARFP